MGSNAKAIYLATRKQHDLLFNVYVMRPLAAVLVSLIGNSRVTPNQLTILSVGLFVGSVATLVGLEPASNVIVAMCLLEGSYLLDCADGMLARHRGIASQEGHLFDFFTDELKAVLLAAGLSVHCWRHGGYAYDGNLRPPGDELFLVAGLAIVVIIASATSLTNFLRHPVIAKRETPVEAHYESKDNQLESSTSVLTRLGHSAMTLMRFLNHYPSHIWLFALLGRLDLFFWIWGSLNLLYLGQGWLGLVMRFGRT